MRRWWSGQSQQTVNLSPSGFAGSNPALRTKNNEAQYESIARFIFLRTAGFEGQKRYTRRKLCLSACR